MAIVASVPATFTAFGPAYSVTFAVPAGTWTSAVWSMDYVLSTVGPGPNSMVVETAGGNVVIGTHSSGGSYTDEGPANAGQLVDINTAAGGTLSVQVSSAIWSSAVSSFTLELFGTPGGGGNDVTSDPVEGDLTINPTPISVTLQATSYDQFLMLDTIAGRCGGTTPVTSLPVQGVLDTQDGMITNGSNIYVSSTPVQL